MSAPPAPRPPTAFVHGDGAVVIVPARIAARLDALVNLRRLRIEVRGQDAELDAVLVALATGAAAWRASATGSERAPEPELGAPSQQWLSTTEAGDLLGIGDRAVRQAIDGGRLDAHRVAGRWRISREDVEQYRSARMLRAA